MSAPVVRAWSTTPEPLSEGPRWHEERQELLGMVRLHGAMEVAGSASLRGSNTVQE